MGMVRITRVWGIVNVTRDMKIELSCSLSIS